jgi:hypothetical protein
MQDMSNGGQGAQQDGLNIGDKPFLMDEVTKQADAQMKWQSNKSGAYTELEDKMICTS